MAFPSGTPSTTTAASLGNTITSYYDKAMLEWMRPNWRFYTFAAKKPLPQNAGSSVVWNRKVALGQPGFVLSEGYPMSGNKTISTNKVSALLQQIGDTVNVSDYARLTSVINTDAYAMEIMADQATDSVEQYIIEAIVADTQVNHYVKVDGGLSGKTIGAANVGDPRLSLLSAGINARLALSDIRVAVTQLQSVNAPTYDNENNYLGIVHPNQLQTLYSDSSFSGWAQYQNPEKMYDYEVGKVFNCRVMTSTKTPIAPGSSLSAEMFSMDSASAYKTYGMVIFGKDAFGVTEIDGGFKTYKESGSQKSDILNMQDVYGWKANIASKVLNPSAVCVLWNQLGEKIYTGDNEDVLGNSGRYAKGHGCNVLFPSTLTDFFETIFQAY